MEKICPFCTNTVREQAFLKSKNFMAIYNIAPVLPSHSLVFPLRHIESVFELNQEEKNEFLEFMQNSTRVLLKAFKGEGFDWSVQEKECAGQSVHHLHIHIVIRKVGDLESEGKWYPLVEENDNQLLDSRLRRKLSQEELTTITNQLKMVAGQLSKE